MERPQPRQNRKADERQRENPYLKRLRKSEFREFEKAHRFSARDHKRRDHANQNHRASHKRIQRKLHRAVFLARRTPDRDQEIFWNDRQFIKNEDQKQIEAEEHAVHTADQREIKREKFFRTILDIPRK